MKRYRTWRRRQTSRLALIPVPGPPRISSGGRLIYTVTPQFVERRRELF